MEFSDIELKHSDTKSSDAPIYVNTTISTESVAHTTTPKSGNTGENEGHYEKLRLGPKQTEADRNARRSIRLEDIPNRIKYAIYASIAVIVVLFVVDIVVIVLIALPKSKVDGSWIQWSPWSNCDVTCNDGTQTRMRFCINPAPSNGGIDCSGQSIDTKKCEHDDCSVDGSWIQWSPWSNCDVTCNNGTQTRMRFCINPVPSNGGIDCSGKSVDTKQCENDGCSVHGSWSQWSPWGSCSVSCGIGMERRDRTCSRPYPSRTGDQCYGESRDDRICMPSSCADGGWSSWGSWGSCSDSCDGGVRSRLRTCTNPRPSLLGRYCDGSPEQVIPCNKHTCSDGGWSSWGSWGSCSDSCDGGVRTRLRTCTNPRPSLLGRYCDGSPEQVIQCNKHTCSDGGWSTWGSWGSCSDSCDGGIRSRLRTCTNPRPSLLGGHCDGSPEQVMPCNKQTCSDHKVAFTAYSSTSGTSSTVIKFPSTRLNIGGGYNTSTGRFTCEIPGIYNFAVTLTKVRQNISSISAYLGVNGYNNLQLYSDPDDTHDDHVDYGSYSLSVAGNFHLNKNDYVYVYGVPGYFYSDYKTSFTGVLVIPNE